MAYLRSSKAGKYNFVAFNHFQQHTSHMNMMLITAIKLMGKCTKHAVTIWQGIMHKATLTHQEAFNISKCRRGSIFWNKWSGHCDTQWECKVRGCYRLWEVISYNHDGVIWIFTYPNPQIVILNIQLSTGPLLPMCSDKWPFIV